MCLRIASESEQRSATVFLSVNLSESEEHSELVCEFLLDQNEKSNTFSILLTQRNFTGFLIGFVRSWSKMPTTLDKKE